MVLQTSGQICLDDLVTEFGGTAPHCLSEYYRGGGLVPDTATNSGIPSSGTLCMDDFYGGDVISGPPTGSLYSMGASATYSGKYGMFERADRVGQGRYITNSTNNLPSTDADNEVTTMSQVGTDTDWRYTSITVQGFGVGMKDDNTGWFITTQTINSTQLPKYSPGERYFNGPGDEGYRGKPFQIFNNNLEKISGGPSSRISMIRTDGRLWMAGANGVLYVGAGYLGAGLPSFDIQYSDHTSPQQIAGGGTNWASTCTNAATKTDGKLWIWGGNGSTFSTTTYGYLGTGSSNPSLQVSTPIQVTGTTDWARVTSFNNTSAKIAQKTDGRIWGWGQQMKSLIGGMPTLNGANQSSYAITPIQLVSGGNWDYFRSMKGIKTDGRLWQWSNVTGSARDSLAGVALHSTPLQIMGGGTNWDFPNWDNFNEADTSYYSAMAWVKTDGRAWSTGHTYWFGTSGSNRYMDATGAVSTSEPTSTPRQLQGNRTDWIYADLEPQTSFMAIR
jgi:hypothetical protein